jgi:hypothetical protein
MIMRFMQATQAGQLVAGRAGGDHGAGDGALSAVALAIG